MLSLLSFLQEAAFTQQAFSFERTSLEARNMAGRLQGGYETVRSHDDIAHLDYHPLMMT